MAKSQNDLGRGSVGRLLFNMALPAIAAQLINVLYNLVDRMYIGHIEGIGDLALTGVGVTFPVIMIISAFSMLVGMGGAPRASMKMGARILTAQGAFSATAPACWSLCRLSLRLLSWRLGAISSFCSARAATQSATRWITWRFTRPVQFCTACFGAQPIYFSPGLCKDQYAHNRYRSGFKYCARPRFYFCLRHGS